MTQRLEYVREFPHYLNYQVEDIHPHSIPTYRRPENAQGDEEPEISRDHWAIDPFATRAPKISDLESLALQDYSAGRSRFREKIQDTVLSYKQDFDERRLNSRSNSHLRMSTIVGFGAVSALSIAEAAYRSELSTIFDHASSLRRKLRVNTLFIQTIGEYARFIDRRQDQICNTKAVGFRIMSREYPGVAATHEYSRERFTPRLRELLGEAGLQGYHDACAATDQAIPPYLTEIAKVNDPAFTNPPLGLLPKRSLVDAASRTRLAVVSKELLAPTVREYAHIAIAYNKVLERQRSVS